MVVNERLMKLSLNEEQIIASIAKAQHHLSIALRDNLRSRHPNIQFDCILRGYIGELAITNWLDQNGVTIEANNIMYDDQNIDIDFLYRNKNIELKTSLLPDVDGNIENAIKNRDIKLIKREDKIEDLRGDVHLQVFFSQKRNAKDKWLSSQKIDLKSNDLNYLYDAFKAKVYLNTTFFVGWIDKPSLIERIKQLPENNRNWSFSGSKRIFWICKIKNSKKPIDLVEYLLDL